MSRPLPWWRGAWKGKALIDQVLGLLLGVGDLRGFLELGGPVLTLVLVAGFFMWLLIIERILYLAFGLERDLRGCREHWRRRQEHGSWAAHVIRRGLLAELEMRATGPLPLIKTLIALAPLLGLLGTVTGMLEMFEIMARTGSANPRVMAAGIARATIPTMAGMLMAVVGLYVNALLSGWTERALRHARFHVLELEAGSHAQA